MEGAARGRASICHLTTAAKRQFRLSSAWIGVFYLFALPLLPGSVRSIVGKSFNYPLTQRVPVDVKDELSKTRGLQRLVRRFTDVSIPSELFHRGLYCPSGSAVGKAYLGSVSSL